MSETRRSYPDPVSSISFAELLGVFFKGLLQAIRDLIRLIFRNKILIICFLVIGVTAGVLRHKTSPAYYNVDMTVRHTELTNQVYGQMIRSLDNLVASGASEMLAHVLRLDASMAGQIRSISARELDGRDMLKDTSSLREGIFVIEMTLSHAEVADTLETALLKYFNDNPFINKLKQDQIQLHSRRLELMDGELRKIDSLMKASNTFNSADLLKQLLKFADTRQNIEGWLLGKRESLQLIDGVKPTMTPASNNLVSMIILYAVIFFIAGCLAGGVLELLKKPSI